MKDKKYFALRLVVGILLCVAIVYGTAKANQHTPDDMNMQSINAEVNVSKGIAQPESTMQNISISEEGFYVFQVNCKPDHEGLVTGCVIYDEKEQVVFSCSGEEWTAESSKLNLKVGKYRVEFCYLSNENDYKDFWKNAGKELSKDAEYKFPDDGEWNICLKYGYGEVKGESLEYYLGVVIGIAIGIIFVAFLKWLIQKIGGRFGCKNCKESYDERQMIARGQAYKTAFFTLMFYMCIVSFISEFSGNPLLMSFTGIWIGVCLSIIVFAIVCIIKDAYMSLYENAKGIIMMFLVVGISNIVIGILNLEKQPMIENEALSIHCINLIVGITFLIILAVFCGKLLYDRRNTKEEE